MPNGRPSADSPPQRPVAWAIEMAVERVRKESERSGLRRAAPCPRLYTRRPAEEIAMAQPPRNPRPDVWPTLPYKAWQARCVRSEERRVGKECVSTGSARGWQYN